MKLNPETAKREMKAQRWQVKAMADECNVDRTVLSSYLSGARVCSDWRVIEGMARVLNLNPYGLLGPEDPKAALAEMCEAFGLSADELRALEIERAAA